MTSIRRIIIPLYIELLEGSSSFRDDVTTWDMTTLMSAGPGERFYFPEEPIEDRVVEVDD